MFRTGVERRLTDVSGRLRRAREELVVLDQQLAVLVEQSDETGVRALVSDDRSAERDHREHQRHTDAMKRSRQELLARIDELESSQDDLLGRLDPTP